MTGGHTYNTAGAFTARITISDAAGDTATTTANVTVAASRLVATPFSDPFQAIAGASYNNIPLAGFTDLGVPQGTQAASSDYTATVNWGDGTTTAGEIMTFGPVPEAAYANPATFGVSGQHTYASTGTYTVQVTISDQAGDTVTATRTIDVSSLSLTAQGRDVSVLTGAGDQPVVVASLTTDPADANVPGSDYSVTIDWGDGSTPTAGAVVGVEYPPGPSIEAEPAIPISQGGLLVTGEHAYTQAGTYTIQVTINGPGGASATATATATVASIAVEGVSFNATTNQADTGQTVADFQASNAAAKPSDFTATIDWGDGTTTSGTVSAVPLLIAQPVAGGQAGPNMPVAVEPNGNGGGPAIPPYLDRFLVSGDHAYRASGTYTVHVTISASSGASVTTTSTATVSADTINAFPLPVQVAPGQSGTSIDVASFHDQAGLPASDFTVKIDWGDGSAPTSGTVEPGPVIDPVPFTPVPPTGVASTTVNQPLQPYFPGSFYLVTGNHTYATAGQYTIKVTITSTLGASASVSAPAFVGTTPPPPIVTYPPPVPLPTPVVVGKKHPHGTIKHSGSSTPVVHPSGHHGGHTLSAHGPGHVQKGLKFKKH